MIVSVFDKDREILITSGEDDEEGVWFTVAEPLVERAKRDLFLAIVPELDAEGNLVDWVPVPTGATRDSDDGLCETCAFVDEEYARVNDSELTRDALALQNAALKAELADLKRTVHNLRVFRWTCGDSDKGEFRVHLCEREWDALLALTAVR